MERSPQEAARRLRELRGIAENKRTDAEWEELNELEIVLAQGNQKSAMNPNPGGNQKQGGQGGGGNPRSGDRPGFQKKQGQPRRRR